MNSLRIFLPFSGGGIPERLLRNRGRIRQAVSSHLAHELKRAFQAFMQGEWNPPVNRMVSCYRISLTSWRLRLPSLPLSLVLLLQQSLRPKEIVVWLTREDFQMFDGEVRNRFGEFGVRFGICDDLKSHKKWLPMIEEGHRTPFVVCDDDTIYPTSWFERLVAEDRSDAYVGAKCHWIICDQSGLIAPYSVWKKQIRTNGEPSHSVFITGCGGAVIHPDRIPREFLDRSAITQKCPKADDIWLKAAHLAAGIPCYKTRYSFPCLELPGTYESGLAKSNVDDGGNDEQIRNVSQYFSMIPHQIEGKPNNALIYEHNMDQLPRNAPIKDQPLSIDVPILMYHGVFRPGTALTPYGIYADQLERQLRVLKHNKFQTVTFGQLLRIVLRQAPRPEKMAVLTFDDGYIDFVECALPLLRKFGMTATIFLVHSRLGKPGFMDVNGVREAMKAGIEVGVHGLNHRDLCRCSEAELYEEIVVAKERLEASLGVSMPTFCYPYGCHRATHYEILASAGYLGAAAVFSAEPSVTHNRYAMRRVCPNQKDGPFRFRFKLSPVYLKWLAYRDRHRKVDC